MLRAAVLFAAIAGIEAGPKITNKVFFDVEIDGTRPARPTVFEADLVAGAPPEVDVTIDFAVQSYRLGVDGAYEGSFSERREGGRVDLYLVNDINLDRYWNGEEFQSHLVQLDQSSGQLNVSLPLNGRWHLVLANDVALTSTMVGRLQVTAEPHSASPWGSAVT